MPRFEGRKSEGKWAHSNGGFRFNGSWDSQGDPDSTLTRFVKELRHDRHTSTVSPAEICQRIPQTFSQAFPCRNQWEKCVSWSDARAESAVESAIVYAFRSPSGEPRPEPNPAAHEESLSSTAYLAHLSSTADRINKGCSLHGITDPYDPRRIEVHRLHGELVAKGIADPNEIVRVVAHGLNETAPRSSLSVAQAKDPG